MGTVGRSAKRDMRTRLRVWGLYRSGSGGIENDTRLIRGS